MTKTEKMIRDILEDNNKQIGDLVCSIDQTARLLFEQKIPMDNIMVTTAVYAAVAGQIDKETGAVAKEVQRLVRDCWTQGNQHKLETYIGRKLKYPPRPRSALCYFAFYSHLGIPFFEYIERDPRVLF